MKYSKLFLPLIFSLLFFSSCGIFNFSKGWPEDEKEDFLEVCVESVKGIPNVDPQTVCSCMLEKFESKYKNKEEAQQMTDEEIEAYVIECLK